MKKITTYIFLILLSILSFYITNKTIKYLEEKDSLMHLLKNIRNNYFQNSIPAILEEDTIIPGINGYKININKSYNNIKRVGFFNDQLLIYDVIDVQNKLEDNKDKYVIKGNANKKMISIFLYLDDIDTLKDYNVSFNYIVNYGFFIDNYDYLKSLIADGHNIVIADINKENIKKYAVKINKTKQINNYCFNINKDNDFKDLCLKNDFYSIYTDVITSNYLLTIKKNLTSGSFIVLKGNYQKELINIINYIYSKGYNIVNLDNHLKETM